METKEKSPTMKATLYGSVEKPVVALAGSWDPILPSHIQAVKGLIRYAHKNSLSSVLIIFDPAPALFVLKQKDETAEWITYNDTDINISRLLQCGLDAILVIHFQPAYLTFGVAELFDTVCAYSNLVEFWFGADQSFGRGANGAQEAVVELAQLHGFRLKRLPQTNLNKISTKVRQFIATGYFAEAIKCVDYPVIRQRPQDGVLNLPWKPGLYQALPLDCPMEVVVTDDTVDKTIKLALYAKNNRVSVCEWPDPQVPYLAFVAGPRDISYALGGK